MSKILRINHIAIAVNNLDDAMPFWKDVLGIPIDHIEAVPSQKSKVAFFILTSPRAIATRSVSGFAPTSTMCALPFSSIWVNFFMGALYRSLL